MRLLLRNLRDGLSPSRALRGFWVREWEPILLLVLSGAVLWLSVLAVVHGHQATAQCRDLHELVHYVNARFHILLAPHLHDCP